MLHHECLAIKLFLLLFANRWIIIYDFFIVCPLVCFARPMSKVINYKCIRSNSRDAVLFGFGFRVE